MGGTSSPPVGDLVGKVMLWVADPDHIVANLRALGILDPKKWRCPCRLSTCRAVVAYGQHDDGSLYFQANQTFENGPAGRTAIRVTKARDLGDISPMGAFLPANDVNMYRLWMMAGLKEALAAEFSQGD
jgi:hypothetical protein